MARANPKIRFALRTLFILVPIAVFILLFTCLSTFDTHAFEDGFYYQKRSGYPSSIEQQDEKTDDLDTRVEVEIDSAEVFSVTNDNSECHVLIRTGEGSSIDEDRTRALVVDGTTYREERAGSILYFMITGKDHAKKVAKFLNTTVTWRAHPKHQLQFSITPEKESFDGKGSVNLLVTYRNVGKQSVCFMRGSYSRGSGRDNQYSFFAKHRGRTVADIDYDWHFGGISGPVTLKPGETHQETQNLSKWFSFESSGEYAVTGVIELEYVRPDADSGMRTIWTEGISAKTTVNLTPEEP